MKTKNKVKCLLSLLLMAALLLTGCASKNTLNDVSMDGADDYYDGGAAAYESESPGGGAENALVGTPGSENRKIIYNAELSIQTKEFSQSQESLAAAVKSAGGYIESSRISGGYYAGTNNYTQQRLECVVRVPSDNFAGFLDSAGSIGEVTSLSYATEDVTLTYLDIEARISSLETQEQRLLELLASAASLDELLTLEGQLADIRYQIESLTSQLNLFDDLVDYSTINLYLSENVEVSPVAKEDFWSRAWYNIRNSGTVVLRVLDGFVMVLIYAAPWLIVLGVAWLLLRKRLKQNRERKKQQTQEKYEAQLRAQAEANAAMQQQMQQRYGPAAPLGEPPQQRPTAPPTAEPKPDKKGDAK